MASFEVAEPGLRAPGDERGDLLGLPVTVVLRPYGPVEPTAADLAKFVLPKLPPVEAALRRRIDIDAVIALVRAGKRLVILPVVMVVELVRRLLTVIRQRLQTGIGVRLRSLHRRLRAGPPPLAVRLATALDIAPGAPAPA